MGRIYKIPVVITEHGEIIDKYMRSRFKYFKDIFRTIIAKFVFKRALIITVSDSLREHIESFGIKINYAVVPNVINTDFFKPIEVGRGRRAGRKKKKMIFIGGLTPRKGIPYLLEALKIVRDGGRNDFIMHIVGDGPYRKRYEEMAKNMNIDNKVIFHGKVTDEEKLRLLQEVDFMVLPSLYESFGVVLLEAMACGKPVITTSSGGQKEFVNENTGILVPPKDANALADAIEFMLDHCHEYSPQKLHEYVRENFSYEKIGRQLHEIYESVRDKWGK